MGWVCGNCGAMLSSTEVNCCVCQNDRSNAFKYRSKLLRMPKRHRKKGGGLKHEFI